MKVTVNWATPNIDQTIARIARVSNPANEHNDVTAERLIRYLIRHAEWSPFEHAYVSVLIEGVSRAITRQMLRHRSFTFQEFSGRYAEHEVLPKVALRKAVPAGGNKQSSKLPETDEERQRYSTLENKAAFIGTLLVSMYKIMLQIGVARETARAILPEGLAVTRLHMTGNIRSWLHYCALRRKEDTQLEHREVAEEIWRILGGLCPLTVAAFEEIAHAEKSP